MNTEQLTLEVREGTELDSCEFMSAQGARIAITPAIGEDFWAFRVKLSDTQAILGFPKFFTIGIGFAQESNWNTNLPYTCDAEKIFGHIEENKGDDNIPDSDCLKAIRLIQAAAATIQSGG